MNLRARYLNKTFTGVPFSLLNTTILAGKFQLLLDKFSGAAAAYSLRALSKDSTNVVKVRRDSDNAERDFTAVEVSDGTLEAWTKGTLSTTAPADYGSGAAAAYSLRIVSDSYTGPVVKVRRSDDNAEADFTAEEVSDGTLLAWVGTTASDDGFVTTWYDQSGNSNDATQATAASQPKIVDAGVLVTENGKAALDFDGTDDSFDLTSGFPLVDFFVVSQIDGDRNIFLTNNSLFLILGETVKFSGYFSSQFDLSINANFYNILYVNRDNGNVYVNGVLRGTQTLGSGVNITGIGKRRFNDFYFGKPMQELILYPSDQSANRADIEGDINDYYGIYTAPSGFVTTWYDQSGNSNDATQATAASQPKIVDAGVFLDDQINLDKVDDRLVANLPAIDGTMVLATPEGTAAYGVNISAGNYDIGGRGGDHFPGSALVGQVIRDGAMTQNEIDQTIAYFRANGGGESYGSVTNFSSFWRDWSELTSFPLIDTSSGTDFSRAWQDCSNLTSFPLIDTSSGTDFSRAWRDCSNLTSFPLIDTSSGTFFQNAWRDCTSLVSFPSLDFSSATNFKTAWENCSSLTTFPANVFDTCTATEFGTAFANTNLSQTSIDNILVSINTANTSNGTFDQSGGSAPSATGEAAIDALRARGWTVTVTGGY